MTYVIETFGLTKEFSPAKGIYHYFFHPFRKGKPIVAVDNVTLQIEKGKIFGIVGPNGAGKTTLIKILSCLIMPSGGSASVAGYNILNQDNAVRASIGLISGDERSFYWRLTLRQNISFFAALYNLSAAQTKVKIAELSCLLEIEPYLDRMFQKCPSGVKQKLSIMRSLLNNPQILFMDEPTKSLDPTTAESFKNFVKEKLVKEQGKTVFFSSHNLIEVENFADRLAIIHKGQIRVSGTLEEICDKTNSPLARLADIYNKIINANSV
jgi:ABC-2 type transport system ATP-binding protein